MRCCSGRAAALLPAFFVAAARPAHAASYKMYRFTALRTGGTGTMDGPQLSEVEFKNGGKVVGGGKGLGAAGATATNDGGVNPPSDKEGCLKAIDGDLATKWFDTHRKPLIVVFPAATPVDSFTFATANDSPARDPVQWTLAGSTDGAQWDTLLAEEFQPTAARETEQKWIAIGAPIPPPPPTPKPPPPPPPAPHGHGCTDGGSGGCGPPVGEKWDRWDMAGSTYTYCYHGCVVDWLMNNTDKLGLGEYGGVVGVDHYWTHQGMPCVDGEPQEFTKQDALAQKWKAKFPTTRMLQYRILSAVNYDMVVQNKILSDPDSVVRWRHQPGDASKPGDGTVCWNNVSGCFNSPTRINNPANKCGFHISAAAYNWSNPNLASWYIKEVVAPSLVHSDGIWLDGIGPDNGAYLCSGVCCGYGAHNSPLVEDEITAHCDDQAKATTAMQKYLIANGGWEAMKCFDYKGGGELPNAGDNPTQCAAKLEKWATFGADHSNYNFVVAYGSRTGGRDHWDDSNAAGTVAAFMLIRGQHWLFSIGPNGGSGGKSYPPYDQDPGTLTTATAQLLTSNYGRPKGNMTAVAGKNGVFQRVYEKATVSLDCSDFSGSFEAHEAGEAP